MRISRSLLIAVIAVCGCRPAASDTEQAAAPATPPVAGASAAPPPAPASPLPSEQAGEIAQAELLGIWRVTGVVPDKGSRFAADDPAITGSLVDILPDQLRWSYTASPRFDSDDLCLGPVAGIIDDPDYGARVRQQIAPALAGKGMDRLSQPHQWLCGDEGEWGNDAAFQRIGDDRLAMRWNGNVTLLLTRIRKVAANPPPLPPTGAYEAR